MILTGLDESMFHQGPDPFVVVGTSDHRFFDRYWFSGIAPDGAIAFFAGTGRYAIMSTRDAFLNVIRGPTQHNVRLSREIDVVEDAQSVAAHGRPVAEVGSFRVEVEEPFRRIRLRLDAVAGDPSGLRADLLLTSDRPAHLEARHREMSGQRLVQEQSRYDQTGVWNGWLEVAGQRHDVVDWWGDRDHSWGIRVDVGGLEPPALSRRTSSLTVWCNFATESRCGLFHLRRYGDGRPPYLDGRVYERDGSTRAVVAIDEDVETAPGGWASARFRVTLEDGQVLAVVAEPATERSWASRGGGYNRGFADGLGVRRAPWRRRRGGCLRPDRTRRCRVQRPTGRSRPP